MGFYADFAADTKPVEAYAGYGDGTVEDLMMDYDRTTGQGRVYGLHDYTFEHTFTVTYFIKTRDGWSDADTFFVTAGSCGCGDQPADEAEPDGLASLPGGTATTSSTEMNAADAALFQDVPHVTTAYVAGTSWTPSFLQFMAAAGQGSAQYGYAVPGGDQLNELPWSNLNRVSITFDQNVQVDQADLGVRGIRVSNYPVTAFAYDAASRTATWTLGQAVVNDRILLDLDADSPNGVKNDSGVFLDGE